MDITEHRLVTWLQERHHGILSYIKGMHCEREEPENHNIRVRSEKAGSAEVWDAVAGVWLRISKTQACEDLIRQAYRAITSNAEKRKALIIDDDYDGNEDDFRADLV